MKILPLVQPKCLLLSGYEDATIIADFLNDLLNLCFVLCALCILYILLHKNTITQCSLYQQ